MSEATLSRRQAYAWPTIALATGAWLLWAAQFSLGAAGIWPAWAALMGNTICAYILFTPMHDACHGSVGRSRRVNDWVGRISGALMNPLLAFAAFRYLHLQHHRSTNECGNDPDLWASGSRWWQIAARCATIDVAYWIFYVRRAAQRPGREVVENWISLALQLGVLVGMIALGFLGEVLLFWILPGRIAIFVLAWLFDYLPHQPHQVLQKDDRFRATNIRVGMERWLSPIMLWQNYHLVHHLYPKEPFWKAVELWRSKESWHLEQSPSMVDVWGRPLSVQQYARLRARDADVTAALGDQSDSPAS
jgi:fatty acid desaturase